MKSPGRRFVSVLVFILVAVALPVAGSGGDDAAVIHAAIKDWAAASKAKDAERFASVYADDAVVMLEGAPDMTGIDAIREGIAGMMQDPNFSLWFEADNVVVSKSGDLAYETGTYGLSISDPDGNKVSQSGHYVVVWRKGADGKWKVVIDAPISDPPEAAAAK